MNKLQLSLIAIGILAVTGISAGLIAFHSQNTNHLSTSSSPSITYYDDLQISVLIQSLMGQSQQDQKNILKQFVKGHKFFSAPQLVQLLSYLKQFNNSNNALSILKAYIPPLSTDEAVQIISQLDTFYDDTVLCDIIISQVYDLSSEENQKKIQNVVPLQYITKLFIQPQGIKGVINGFRLTLEGGHIAFLIDKSKSMNTFIARHSFGANFTRQDAVNQFMNERYNILTGITTFSYGFITTNPQLSDVVESKLYTFGQANGLLDTYLGNFLGDGETDLQSSLLRLLSNPEDNISDLYIITDGIITQGPSDVDTFVNIINQTNSQRRNKIRVNTVSVLIGGEESSTQRQQSYDLLTGISDATQGTFIQYQPIIS